MLTCVLHLIDPILNKYTEKKALFFSFIALVQELLDRNPSQTSDQLSQPDKVKSRLY